MHADKTARRRRSTVQGRGSTHPRRLIVSTEAVFLVLLKHVSIKGLTMKKLEGIIAPMATPLTRDEKIDDKTTRTLVDFLIDGGIDGLFPLGTSGEFALLDREERKTVIETVVDHTNGRVPVLAGVSDPGLENVLAFAKDAKDAGADAIVATPRSEEHTSELQSQSNLVCRLLLEKKKNTQPSSVRAQISILASPSASGPTSQPHCARLRRSPNRLSTDCTDLYDTLTRHTTSSSRH